MIAFLRALAVVFMVLGVFMIFKLTPEQFTQDIMDLLRPADKLRTQASDLQARRRRGGLYNELMRIRNTMEVTGRGKLFPFAVTSVVGFAVLGVVVAIMLDNMWLIPTLVVGFGSLPFLYMSSAVEFHEKSIRNEMETALSVITNAYIRTDDIVVAVEENLAFIKPPLRKVFERFVQDSVVFASNKEIIVRLRNRLSDQVFYEWCTTLLQCQDDRTLKDNLNPVVSKLTDIRLINSQIEAVVATAKTEYYALIGFVIACIPMMSVLSPGSLEVLQHTLFGKILVGVISFIVLMTYFNMRRITRPVDFDSK